MKAKLKAKGHLLNRNFTSYQVGNHVCGALTIEMSEKNVLDRNEKPKTFFASNERKKRAGLKNLKLSLQVKKVISES